MELLQLKYFCSAAETQNFSETAKKFGVPSSGISQSIKRLEEELGTLLFTRSANKVSINAQGKVLYKEVSTALMLLENAKNKLKDEDSFVSGEVRILAQTNRRIVTRAIERFKEQYNDVNFLINHSLSAKPGDFDIIISDDETNLHNFSETLLVSEKFLLAVRKKDIPLTPDLTLEDFRNRNFITMPKGSSHFIHTNRICRAEGFAPDITIQIDDPYYLRKYVEMGLGIAFVPEISWQGMFSTDVSLIDIGNYTRNTYIFQNPNRYKTKAVMVFLDTLLNRVK